MSLHKSLLAEEISLEQRLLKNKKAQYDYLVKLSLLPISDKNTLESKMDIMDRLRDLENSIRQQLGDMAKAAAQTELYKNHFQTHVDRIRNEKLRSAMQREAEKKYKGMSLRDLAKDYFERYGTKPQ